MDVMLRVLTRFVPALGGVSSLKPVHLLHHELRLGSDMFVLVYSPLAGNTLSPVLMAARVGAIGFLNSLAADGTGNRSGSRQSCSPITNPFGASADVGLGTADLVLMGF